MDNLCHTLVGAALAETGLKGRTRLGSAVLMVSANLPDLDVLVFATDTPAVAFRRGWTHGIVAQLLLPLALSAVFWIVARTMRRPRAGVPAVSVRWLLALSYLGLYSHIFLDYLNNYGVRLLAPIDWRWFYGDAVFIVDPFLWVVLALGVWFARRRHRTIIAAFSLLLALVYVSGMLVSARVAHHIVENMWVATHGQPPRALMVGPRFGSPLTRDVVVDVGDHYEWGTFDWPSTLRLDRQPIPKHAELPAVRAARESPNIRPFLVWSRFPFWTVEPTSGGVRVTAADARFLMGRRVFAATTVVRSGSSGPPGKNPDAGHEGRP